jgi:hypothetical protein
MPAKKKKGTTPAEAEKAKVDPTFYEKQFQNILYGLINSILTIPCMVR